jgi:hypothetical protein
MNDVRYLERGSPLPLAATAGKGKYKEFFIC